MSVCGTMHKVIYELQVRLTLLRALKKLQARQTESYTELEAVYSNYYGDHMQCLSLTFVVSKQGL